MGPKIISRICCIGMIVACFFVIAPCLAQSVSELYEKGYSLEKVSKFNDALALYDQALILEPNNITILQRKMDVLQSQARWEEANEVMLIAEQNYPNSTVPSFYYYWFTGGSRMCAEYRSNGINAIIYQNDYKSALFYFKRVQEMCPNDSNNVPMYGDEGYIYYKLGQFNESIASYDNAIKLSNAKIAEYSNSKNFEKYKKNKEHVEIDRQKILNKIHEMNEKSPALPVVTPASTLPEVNKSGTIVTKETNQGPITPKDTKKAPGSSSIILFSIGITMALFAAHKRK